MDDMRAQELAAIDMIRAIADAIREIKQVPSGELYARLMGHMDIHTYERIINMLVNAKLITNRGHLLVWVGGEIETESKVSR